MNTYIRTLLRNRILDVLGSFASPSNSIHILNGHWTLNEAESPEQFRFVLRSLSKKVEFVRFEEAVRMIVERKEVNRPLVSFTFDDGFIECYTHYAPVLEEFGVNAAFFVNPNFVGGGAEYIKRFTEELMHNPQKRPMGWDKIKELRDRGHIIGAHTMDHYMINTDDTKELEYQIGDCKKVIEEQLGGPCVYFAFPYGRLEHANSMAIDIACKHYKYVFSQSDYKHYFSFGGRVINRRHFESSWPLPHINYFLSSKKR